MLNTFLFSPFWFWKIIWHLDIFHLMKTRFSPAWGVHLCVNGPVSRFRSCWVPSSSSAEMAIYCNGQPCPDCCLMSRWSALRHPLGLSQVQVLIASLDCCRSLCISWANPQSCCSWTWPAVLWPRCKMLGHPGGGMTCTCRHPHEACGSW